MFAFSKVLSANTPPEFNEWPMDKQRAAWNAVCAKFRPGRPEGLTAQDLEIFLGPRSSQNWHDKKAVPNLAFDVSNLPPCFITVAGHDPLYDDGVLFAQKLNAAGVSCTLRKEPELAHSYMRARNVSVPAKKGFDAIVEALKAF